MLTRDYRNFNKGELTWASVGRFGKGNCCKIARASMFFLLPLLASLIVVASSPSISSWLNFLRTKYTEQFALIGRDRFVLIVWMFASTLIVFLGTFSFWKDIGKQQLMYKGNNRLVDRDYGRALSMTFWSVVGVLMLISGMIIALLAMLVLATDLLSYILLCFEFMSAVIFLMFACIDHWLERATRVASMDEDTKPRWIAYEQLHVMSVDSIMFIDVPVLIAALALFGVSLFHQISGEHVHSGAIFHYGFLAGGLVTHIIFSQYIFTALKVRDLWYEYHNAGAS
jgi:hypothetical protein